MPAPKTAIIAGKGALPAYLAARLQADGTDFVIAEVEGFAMDNPAGLPVERFAIERLALLFDRLHDLGVARVAFAGAVARPRLNPELIDPKTAMLLPAILPALQQGDDATLRAVIGLFEDEGFTVTGADAIAPDLLPDAGVLTRAQPDDRARADAARAADIVAALGAADVGQGAVVAGGLCLAVETLPGTDAMLAWVAGLPERPAGGVFYKAPKPGQDRRVDLPAIGPGTVAAVKAAGLAGIVIEERGVMLLDPDRTRADAEAAGVFLWVRRP